LWYDASRYDATFAVADVNGRYPAAAFEQFFGKPAATYRVQNWLILEYHTNLLRHLLPRRPIGTGRKQYTRLPPRRQPGRPAAGRELQVSRGRRTW
jgi:hypothetical protein